MVFIQLTNFTPRASNFGTSAIENILISTVLPLHKIFDDFEKFFSFISCLFLVQSILKSSSDIGTRIVHELCKENGPRGRKRTARPPKVNPAGMCADAWHLFIGARDIYRI